MSPHTPSAADLIERLRDVYEEREGVRLSDEKLAGRLPISLSTFNRWKRSDTRGYSDLMEMLDRAGWLNKTADRPLSGEEDRQEADPQAVLIALVSQVLQNQATALRSLGVPEGQIALEPTIQAPQPPSREPGTA